MKYFAELSALLRVVFILVVGWLLGNSPTKD